jgi:hypothetical protein
MAKSWRGLCPRVDCSGLMMMMMKYSKQNLIKIVYELQVGNEISIFKTFDDTKNVEVTEEMNNNKKKDWQSLKCNVSIKCQALSSRQ